MPNYSQRPALIECPALRLADLRAAGAIAPGDLRRGTIEFAQTSGTDRFVVEFTADIRDPRDAYLELRHVTPDHAPADAYRIRLLEIHQPKGGVRWEIICPMRNKPVRALFLPAGASMFASSRAHHLLPESARTNHQGRTLYALQLARLRLERATRPKAGYRGSRGCSVATIGRLRALVLDAELAAWNQTRAKAKRRETTNE